MKLHNKKILKSTRKRLRNQMTHAEVLLWNQLKGRALGGFKFRRQHSIFKYIVDFYCPEAKLAIEVDGVTHIGKEAKLHDNEKENDLKTLNINTLRISNEEIYDNLVTVINRIREKLNLTNQTTP